MATNFSSGFPLLVSDQADVIRIFLDLMCAGDRDGHKSNVTANHDLFGPRNGSDPFSLGAAPMDLS